MAIEGFTKNLLPFKCFENRFSRRQQQNSELFGHFDFLFVQAIFVSLQTSPQRLCSLIVCEHRALFIVVTRILLEFCILADNSLVWPMIRILISGRWPSEAKMLMFLVSTYWIRANKLSIIEGSNKEIGKAREFHIDSLHLRVGGD